MKKLLILFVLTLSLGCGAALPAIIAGITTAADLIQLFDDKISPENQAAQQQCANTIASLPTGAASLTETVASCDELVDAYYALQSVVEQLRTTKGAGAREQSLVEKGKQRAAEFYDSKARVDAVVK